MKLLQLKEGHPSLVNCYRRVFGGDVWKEWKICGNGHKFSIKESDNHNSCPTCQCGLKYHWPEATVSNYISTELGMPDAVGIVAVDNNNTVVGFTWGYTMNWDRARRKFNGHLPYNLMKLGHEFWYQSELGVLDGFQGWGLASLLYRERMRLVLINTDHNFFIIRTFPGAKTYNWYRNRIGYQLVAKYYRPDVKEWRYLLYATRDVIKNYLS